MPMPTPRPGPPPRPTRARMMWTELHRALQVAGGGGSCTRKEIIETGLFMLVGKGAWIWIKPCAHFANYPASVLKEERAHCRFSSQFHPAKPTPTYIHTQITAATTTTTIFSPLIYITDNAPLNMNHMNPFELNLNWHKIPTLYRARRLKEESPILIPVGRSLFSTISTVRTTW